MVNILMHGYAGHMGKVIAGLAESNGGCKIVAGVDKFSSEANFPTFTNLWDCDVPADVIIDFSTAAAVPELLKFAVEKHIPVVQCTTGLSEEQTALLSEAAKSIPVLKSANMSLGINLLMSLVSQSAKLLFDANFDIEIIEKHHNQKIDAPSGTALVLADKMNEVLDNTLNYRYNRADAREKRSHSEIGIHSLRGGSIVGTHDVVFAGKDEIITISHEATSKEIFAVGALKAAQFLFNKPAGLYSMQDLMGEA